MDEALRKKLAVGFLDIPSGRKNSILENNFNETYLKAAFADYAACLENANQVIDWLNRDSEGGIIWQTDASFPLFEGIERHIPYMLFYSGKTPGFSKRCVCVVGTRKVSYKASLRAFSLGTEISANGLSLVSGFAEGCDQCATLGALSCGGRCYEVLGCGLEVDYPSLTKNLKQRVKDCGGCLISRFAPKMPPLKQNFPNRNVIIAAMCNAAIIVQAPSKSGALYTADFALQLGKDIFVTEEGVSDSSMSRGTSKLFDDGCPCIEHLSSVFPDCSVQCFEDPDGNLRFADKHFILKNLS